MTEDWDGFQRELGKLDAVELDQLKDHFNKLIEDEDCIGDALCSDDVVDFKDVVGGLE